MSHQLSIYIFRCLNSSQEQASFSRNIFFRCTLRIMAPLNCTLNLNYRDECTGELLAWFWSPLPCYKSCIAQRSVFCLKPYGMSNFSTFIWRERFLHRLIRKSLQVEFISIIKIAWSQPIFLGNLSCSFYSIKRKSCKIFSLVINLKLTWEYALFMVETGCWQR